MIRFAPLALLLLAAAGCTPRTVVPATPTPVTPAGYPSHTREQIIAAVTAAVAPARSAAVDGRISVKARGLDQDATFSLRARFAGRPTDSVTVVVRGPLGIEGGRGLVTADSLFGVDRINRVLYLGSASAAERFVPGGGSPEAAARAVLGLLVPETGVAWSVQPGNGRYVLTGTLGAGVRRVYTVDPSIWRVVSVREYDAAGALRGQQDASDFETVDGLPMPRRVHVAAQGAEATFEHRRIALNPSDLRLTFSRPDYRTVRLR